MKDFPAAQAAYREKMKEWEEKAYFTDPGNKGFGMGWAAPASDTAGWQPMNLPCYWESTGLMIDGVVWFRRDVQIPADWAGKDLTLSLGPIDDCDTTYFNGEQVGATTMDTPNYWATPRTYTVPGKPGEGRTRRHRRARLRPLAQRRLRRRGDRHEALRQGRRVRPCRSTAAGSTRSRSAARSRQRPSRSRRRPWGRTTPGRPSGLYNAMIAPLIPYGIKGAIWYQGESNADRAYQYRTLFPTMIEDWRKAWGEGDFPFLFVQLANYMPVQTQPAEDSAWAELREAQLMTLSLPKTGMAVIIDVGEANDIHPKDKQTVGARLALAARGDRLRAGRRLLRPVLREHEGRGRQGGPELHARGRRASIAQGGGALKGFAVAGADKKFVWADARIEGDKVVVSSPDVPEPVAVRYDWANNPIGNLYNKEGLPASPFRTDDWPGVTVGRR